MGTLTVKENIMFSANMRLSADIPHEEKERRVDETINELGLSHVANHKVREMTSADKTRFCGYTYWRIDVFMAVCHLLCFHSACIRWATSLSAVCLAESGSEQTSAWS